MSHERNRPPSSDQEGRQAGLEKPGKASNTPNKQSDKRWQDSDSVVFVTTVECIIGSTRVVFRTMNYSHYASAWHFGVHRAAPDRRVTIHRYSDPEQAAYAYRARKHALGIYGILPIQWDEPRRLNAVCAFLTDAGTRSAWAHKCAERMRGLGLFVSDEPPGGENAESFWWVDQ